MTRLREFLLTGAALGLLGIGGVGCTGQGADSAAAPPSGPAATSPAAPTASAPSDGDADVTAQEKRVKAALDTVDPDAPEFVESGTERVADGVHHRSHLTKGVAYRLTLVCAGEGWSYPSSAVRRSRPCRATAFRSRTGSRARRPSSLSPSTVGRAPRVRWAGTSSRSRAERSRGSRPAAVPGGERGAQGEQQQATRPRRQARPEARGAERAGQGGRARGQVDR